MGFENKTTENGERLIWLEPNEAHVGQGHRRAGFADPVHLVSDP
jgi:hypothetical protein